MVYGKIASSAHWAALDKTSHTVQSFDSDPYFVWNKTKEAVVSMKHYDKRVFRLSTCLFFF